MIVEYIRYKIEPERTESFLAAYTEAQESLRASAHCLGYELSRCTEAPAQFILRIRWDSAEGHLNGFRSSPQFPPFLQAIKPFIPSIEEMRHYEVTAIHGERGA